MEVLVLHFVACEASTVAPTGDTILLKKERNNQKVGDSKTTFNVMNSFRTCMTQYAYER